MIMHNFCPRPLVNLFLLTVLVCSAYSKATFGEVTNDTQRSAARTLGLEGLDAYDRGDILTALDRFDRAYQLHPVPSLALWFGRALARSGKLVAASERWLQATR